MRKKIVLIKKFTGETRFTKAIKINQKIMEKQTNFLLVKLFTMIDLFSFDFVDDLDELVSTSGVDGDILFL